MRFSILTLVLCGLFTATTRADDEAEYDIFWTMLDCEVGSYVDQVDNMQAAIDNLTDDLIEASEGDPNDPNDDWPGWATGSVQTLLSDAQDALDECSGHCDDVYVFLTNADMWYSYSPENAWGYIDAAYYSLDYADQNIADYDDSLADAQVDFAYYVSQGFSSTPPSIHYAYSGIYALVNTHYRTAGRLHSELLETSVQAFNKATGQTLTDITALLASASGHLSDATDYLSDAGVYLASAVTVFYSDPSAAYDLLDDADTAASAALAALDAAEENIEDAIDLIP